MTSQIIHFNDGDIEVSQTPIGWQAWEAGQYDCDFNGVSFVPTCIIGDGDTMLSAIADLVEKLKEAD